MLKIAIILLADAAFAARDGAGPSGDVMNRIARPEVGFGR